MCEGYDIPMVKLEIGTSTIVILQRTAELMQIAAKDALMFSFNKSKGIMYMYKEEPEIDCYFTFLSNNQLKISGRDLTQYIVDAFNLKYKRVAYFDVKPEPDDQGRYELTLFRAV